MEEFVPGRVALHAPVAPQRSPEAVRLGRRNAPSPGSSSRRVQKFQPGLALLARPRGADPDHAARPRPATRRKYDVHNFVGAKRCIGPNPRAIRRDVDDRSILLKAGNSPRINQAHKERSRNSFRSARVGLRVRQHRRPPEVPTRSRDNMTKRGRSQARTTKLSDLDK
jgi:hypothetical protein